jgi:hypothetical protein
MSAIKLYQSVSLRNSFEYITKTFANKRSDTIQTLWSDFESLAKARLYLFEPLIGEVKNRSLGKLGTKVEPAGKIRVFAMVDCWTQWALRPLHRYIFDILRYIPMDGTFNQLKPLGSLRPYGGFYSYDLSSATDRLPIALQKPLVSALVQDKDFGEHWANLLVGRDYYLRFHGAVRYSVGQPMGALSS